MIASNQQTYSKACSSAKQVPNSLQADFRTHHEARKDGVLAPARRKADHRVILREVLGARDRLAHEDAQHGLAHVRIPAAPKAKGGEERLQEFGVTLITLDYGIVHSQTRQRPVKIVTSITSTGSQRKGRAPHAAAPTAKSARGQYMNE